MNQGPGTHCQLPDEGIVCYEEPQLLCPNCNLKMYGLFMNKDLFPHLNVKRLRKYTTKQ